jgi:hypothetical protein
LKNKVKVREGNINYYKTLLTSLKTEQKVMEENIEKGERLLKKAQEEAQEEIKEEIKEELREEKQESNLEYAAKLSEYILREEVKSLLGLSNEEAKEVVSIQMSVLINDKNSRELMLNTYDKIKFNAKELGLLDKFS